MKRPRTPLIAFLGLLVSGPMVFGGSLDLPTVEISASNISFGNQVVESRSQAKSVMLLNRGTKALNIKRISASGDFAVESDCGASLEAGHGCTIVTTFSPSFTGDADGKLTIEDDSQSSPHLVSLSGIGVPPVTIAPAMLHFEPRTVGTSATASLTLTNNQSRNLSAVQVSTSVDFAQSNTCGAGIPAGKSCDIRITFMPSRATQVRGKVTLSYGGSTQVVMVSGTGVAAAPLVTGLKISVPKIPAVAALAPIIPPAPAVTAALRSSPRAASRAAGAPEVINPPPAISGTLQPASARLVSHGSPAVIEPPPTTSSLAITAKTAPGTTSALPPAPPAPAASVRVSSMSLVIPSGAVAKEPEPLSAASSAPADTAPLVASAKPSAETSAVTPVATQTAEAPVAAMPAPAPQPAKPVPAIEDAPHAAVMAANISPAITRRAPAAPRVTLIVGLKGTATGTVISSSGAIKCGDACKDEFARGQKIVLSPQALPNSSFAGWRGCDSVVGNNCTVMMDRDKSVTAIFVKHYDDLSPE